MRSLANSPTIRGDTQSEFARDISWIRFRTGLSTAGLPGALRVRRAQWSGNRRRRQAMTCSARPHTVARLVRWSWERSSTLETTPAPNKYAEGVQGSAPPCDRDS